MVRCLRRYRRLTLMVGGLIVPTPFPDGYFSMKISCLFIIHYKLSENQKRIWFFTVILGYIEGVGTITPRPTQATSRSPLLGIIYSSLVNGHPFGWQTFTH